MTTFVNHIFVNNLYFNPHSRKGSDGMDTNIMIDLLMISIHTPARGVTVLPQPLAPIRI